MFVLFDPQYASLSFDVWFLIFFIGSLATYAAAVGSGAPATAMWPLLIIGGYLGNVCARANSWVSVSQSITPQVLLEATYATLGGMFAITCVWFLMKLVLPTLLKPKTLKRPNEPKAVIGQ